MIAGWFKSQHILNKHLCRTSIHYKNYWSVYLHNISMMLIDVATLHISMMLMMLQHCLDMKKWRKDKAIAIVCATIQCKYIQWNNMLRMKYFPKSTDIFFGTIYIQNLTWEPVQFSVFQAYIERTYMMITHTHEF